MTFTFKKAVRSASKLRLALSGTSGSGKTYGALLLAKGIGGKIAVIDTERGSASLYADMSGMPEFDVLDLDAPFTPERYTEAIKAAEDAGYDILIIDSMTHEWNGKGGCLEEVERIAKARYRGNSWSAWNEMTPRHRQFVDAMLTSKLHIIATMRSKTEMAQEDVNGKKVIKKLSMKVEQRDGVDYEFTIMFDLVHDGHFANASKDRTGLFSSRTDPLILTPEVGAEIKKWLDSAGVTPDEFADLMSRTISAETPDELMAMGKEIASKGLCYEDREKIAQAFRARRHELEQAMTEQATQEEANNGISE